MEKAGSRLCYYVCETSALRLIQRYWSGDLSAGEGTKLVDISQDTIMHVFVTFLMGYSSLFVKVCPQFFLQSLTNLFECWFVGSKEFILELCWKDMNRHIHIMTLDKIFEEMSLSPVIRFEFYFTLTQFLTGCLRWMRLVAAELWMSESVFNSTTFAQQIRPDMDVYFRIWKATWKRWHLAGVFFREFPKICTLVHYTLYIQASNWESTSYSDHTKKIAWS